MATKEAAKAKDQKISLTIVVQGTAVALDANVHQPLKSLIGKALAGAAVPGDTENWYFSNEAGAELDAEKSIADLGLVAGQTILLNQRAGAAG
jgi:hypothetical protein